ncbi:MAG: adenylate/guanylate cyclase domain-containing protein [Bdellovibrionota bacterium]
MPLEFRPSRTIAAKIFGLALVLLFLTLCLTVYLLNEVANSEKALQVIASYHLPLANSVTRLHEIGLRRRLAFVRMYGEIGSSMPNKQVIEIASKHYDELNGELAKEIANASALLAAYPAEEDASPAMARAHLLFDQIKESYPLITARQMELLQLQKSHQQREANIVNIGMGDLQEEMQNKREKLRDTMTELSEEATKRSAARGKEIVLLATIATFFTMLLGLFVAALISRRIVKPVQALALAMKDVQKGNLDVAVPVASGDEVGALTGSFNFFIVELKSKERMKTTFGKYIDPRILERVLLQEDGVALAGERRHMTVLFADLVGFTNLSERVTPDLMVTILNRHFGLQAKAVQENKGIVDKFLGDAVMAFWGPPFTGTENHAELACRSALAQVEVLKAFRSELPNLTGLRKDVPVVDLRVGIFSGEVVVGNIGSENTRSYTVIGDTVNLASRLESANRFYGTNILLGDMTAQSAASQFEMREIDFIAVKGHTEAIAVYEPLGMKGSTSAETMKLRDVYSTALERYRKRLWDEAERGFDECLRIRTADGPATKMRERVQAFRVSPPPEGWNGAWIAESK